MVLKHLIIKFSNKLLIGGKVLSFKQDMDFFKLLSLKNKLEKAKHFQLLFRASDHNHSTKKFHNLCDNKGPTISIIKSECGNIYGGYTSKSWTSANGEHTEDKEAFVFLIESKDESTQRRCPLIFNIKRDRRETAVYHFFYAGPCFGGAISIYDNYGNTSSKSWCSGRVSYDYGKLKKSDLVGINGRHSFRVIEYEVFRIR